MTIKEHIRIIYNNQPLIYRLGLNPKSECAGLFIETTTPFFVDRKLIDLTKITAAKLKAICTEIIKHKLTT
jgi:hypothetical protein